MAKTHATPRRSARPSPTTSARAATRAGSARPRWWPCCEGSPQPDHALSGWENAEQLPKADRLFELIAILRLPLTATCVLYAEALREQALEIRGRARAAKRRGGGPGPRRRR